MHDPDERQQALLLIQLRKRESVRIGKFIDESLLDLDEKEQQQIKDYVEKLVKDFETGQQLVRDYRARVGQRLYPIE